MGKQVTVSISGDRALLNDFRGRCQSTIDLLMGRPIELHWTNETGFSFGVASYPPRLFSILSKANQSIHFDVLYTEGLCRGKGAWLNGAGGMVFSRVKAVFQ